MEKKMCDSCVYYFRHYSMDKQRVFRVFCGHCTFEKAKRKDPFREACEHYEHRPPQEDAFADKEYLSKFLLEYMAKLELLPEIHDSDERLK